MPTKQQYISATRIDLKEKTIYSMREQHIKRRRGFTKLSTHIGRSGLIKLKVVQGPYKYQYIMDQKW